MNSHTKQFPIGKRILRTAPATKALTPIEIATAFSTWAGLNPSDYDLYDNYVIFVSNAISGRASIANEVQNAFYPIDDIGPPPSPGVLLFWSELANKSFSYQLPNRFVTYRFRDGVVGMANDMYYLIKDNLTISADPMIFLLAVSTTLANSKIIGIYQYNNVQPPGF